VIATLKTVERLEHEARFEVRRLAVRGTSQIAKSDVAFIIKDELRVSESACAAAPFETICFGDGLCAKEIHWLRSLKIVDCQ